MSQPHLNMRSSIPPHIAALLRRIEVGKVVGLMVGGGQQIVGRVLAVSHEGVIDLDLDPWNVISDIWNPGDENVPNYMGVPADRVPSRASVLLGAVTCVSEYPS